METNSDLLNRWRNNLISISNNQGSRNRTDHVTPFPLYVSASSLGNLDNKGTQESNSSGLQSNSTNSTHTEPKNEPELYIPVCLLPLRRFFAEMNRNLNTPLSPGTGQDLSSSLDSNNKNNTCSTSSFEELTTFPILDAPLDCVWPTIEAVMRQSSLHSSGNTSSSEENSFGESLHVLTNLMNPQALSPESQTAEKVKEEKIFRTNFEDYLNLNELVKLENGEKNAFDPRASNKNNQTYNTGAVPKTFSAVETGNKPDTPVWCRFCFKNNEPACIYKSHQLKSETGIVTCPMLRNYVCPICGVSGDFAHTLSYCSENPKSKFWNQVHLADNATEDNTVQLHSTPNSSLTQPPPLSARIQEQTGMPYSFSNNEETNVQNIARNPIIPSANIVKRKKVVCKFCQRNRETQAIYTSHQIRDETGKIVCPILKRYICGICGATGNNAHTRKYCPKNTYEEFIQKFMCE